MIWEVFKYILFGSIGAAIRLKEVSLNVFGLGMIIVFGGVFVRSYAVVLSVYEK